LVQLRQPETLGVLDDHQAGIWHIDANFDHFPRTHMLSSRLIIYYFMILCCKLIIDNRHL
jgi:hypothetical protein